jgi:hypothetical protein
METTPTAAFSRSGYPDFEAIVNELLKHSQQGRASNLFYQTTPELSASAYLDMYGVGFRAFRQTGKTRYALSQLNAETIVIVTNLSHYNVFIKRLLSARTGHVGKLKTVAAYMELLQRQVVTSRYVLEQLKANAPASMSKNKITIDLGSNITQEQAAIQMAQVVELLSRRIAEVPERPESDSPLWGVRRVIVDEAAYMDCSLKDIVTWARMAGATPDIIVIN